MVYPNSKEHIDLKYVLNGEVLYILTTNSFDKDSIDNFEERKNVRIVSFEDMNNIKTMSYEYIGQNAKQAYVDFTNENKMIEQFIIDEKKSETKKVFIRDYVIDSNTDENIVREPNNNVYNKIEDSGIWYMLDDKGEIFAQGFDGNLNHSFITIDNNKYLLINNAIYGKNGLIINLNKKRLYGAVKKYLIVSNAFYYGLIDLDGNWFYKKNIFDTIDIDE